MNKVIKVKVNKQKPSDACPARLTLIAIKCPLIQRQAALAAIPMLVAGFFVKRTLLNHNDYFFISCVPWSPGMSIILLYLNLVISVIVPQHLVLKVLYVIVNVSVSRLFNFIYAGVVVSG
jgi:hypothetical protein